MTKKTNQNKRTADDTRELGRVAFSLNKKGVPLNLEAKHSGLISLIKGLSGSVFAKGATYPKAKQLNETSMTER